MPIYEYQCGACDTVFEEWQSGFEEREEECPECGTASKRMISNTSFVLKGSGWYVTDYAGKNPSTGGSENGSNNSESASTADSGGTSKCAAKSAA